MRTWPLLLVVTAAVVAVVFAEEDDQSHHLTKRSRSRERMDYGCTSCFGRGSREGRRYGGRSRGGYSHGGHSHGHSSGGRSRGGRRSRGRHSRGRSGGRSRRGHSSESDEYDNGGQPSCRCPFQFQGQQGRSQGPQFGSVGYGRQGGHSDGFYRQWYRAFSTHPCCGGRTGTITFLQRTQGSRQGPR
ncbi:keratin, type I cytoskeletal 9-like [Haliotis rubra]|uniref:keratin, type I cytoskeletal 9-like n=1 Tax=Haliotis rubra TaxID=36100 RepID=UPI001EE5984E|nr:keratin, type I cytoskeletal 9-like [Haliotis rubra]